MAITHSGTYVDGNILYAAELNAEHIGAASLIGSYTTWKSTSGTSFVEMGSIVVGPGSITDYLWVVSNFNSHLWVSGAEDIQGSRGDIQIGISGLETSKMSPGQRELFYLDILAGADKLIETSHNTLHVYYKPTTAELASGVNILILARLTETPDPAFNCLVSHADTFVWGT